MKKTCFLHTSLYLPNAMLRPSIILEEVPVGIFSHGSHSLNAKTRPVLLEVVDNLITSKEIDEVVIVTSDQAEDDLIQTVIESQTEFSKPVSLCRIASDEAYAFRYENRYAEDGQWPYLQKGLYGVWHIQGSLDLIEQYNTDVAFCLQADSAIELNASKLDELLCQYSQKGVRFLKRQSFYEPSFILNRRFAKELFQKFEKKAKSQNQKNGTERFWSVASFFDFYMQDTKRKDFVFFQSQADSVHEGIYRKSDLAFILGLRETEELDVRLLENYLEDLQGPSFFEICFDPQNGPFDERIFQKHLEQAAVSSYVLNLNLTGKPNKDVRKLFSRISEVDIPVFVDVNADENLESWIELFCERLFSLSLIQIACFDKGEDCLTESLLDRLPRSVFRVLKIKNDKKEADANLFSLFDKVVIKSTYGIDSDPDILNLAPPKRTICKKLQNSVSIDLASKVAPCPYLKKKKSCSEGSLAKAFDQKLILEHLSLSIDKKHPCYHCHDWYLQDVLSFFPHHYVPFSADSFVPEENDIARLGSLYEKIVFLEREMAIHRPNDWRYGASIYFLKLKKQMETLLLKSMFVLASNEEMEKGMEILELLLKYSPDPKLREFLDQQLQQTKMISSS